MVVPGRGMALDGRATLPDDAAVDPDRATATLQRDGTLRIDVPKARRGRPARVEDPTTGGDR
jgi:HSP20 family molecular chaperone IbpA